MKYIYIYIYIYIYLIYLFVYMYKYIRQPVEMFAKELDTCQLADRAITDDCGRGEVYFYG